MSKSNCRESWNYTVFDLLPQRNFCGKTSCALAYVPARESSGYFLADFAIAGHEFKNQWQSTGTRGKLPEEN